MVHLALIVFENPQVSDFLGHVDSDNGCIVAADAKQNHEAIADFSRDGTLNGHARATYTLNNCSHAGTRGFSPTNRPDATRPCATHRERRWLPICDTVYDPALVSQLPHPPQRCGLHPETVLRFEILDEHAPH